MGPARPLKEAAAVTLVLAHGSSPEAGESVLRVALAGVGVAAGEAGVDGGPQLGDSARRDMPS